MKIISLICLLILTAIQFALGQSLTLDQLIKIRAMDADGAHSYLSAKGWKFKKAIEGTESTYSMAIWSFGQTATQLHLLNKEGYDNIVVFSPTNKATFENIKAKILTYKMRKESSTIDFGCIKSTYSGQNYKVVLDICTDQNDTSNSPIYIISIETKRSTILKKPES